MNLGVLALIRDCFRDVPQMVVVGIFSKIATLEAWAKCNGRIMQGVVFWHGNCLKEELHFCSRRQV